MAQSFRASEIIDIARREGKVTVEGLAAHFGVTLQTIRRDLTELADSGKLDRVHGGAVLPSGINNIGYEDRRTLNQASKVDIARKCAHDIPEDCSLFLNIGTTTEAVAAELKAHRNLMVVTNNMNVATTLVANETCQVIVAGGRLRRTDGGLVGTLTTETIRQFKFDIAVIGCSAVDADGDIMDFDVDEVGVSQTIINRARKVILVADHTKFQRSAPARIGTLEMVDAIYTDRPLNNELMQRCDEWNTAVIICEPTE